MKKSIKLLTVAVLVAASSVGYVSTASARLQSQVSQGKGVKCYQQLVSSVNNHNVYQRVCRKVGV